jgi:hypothetical protein
MLSGLTEKAGGGLESTSDRVGWKVFCRRRWLEVQYSCLRFY